MRAVTILTILLALLLLGCQGTKLVTSKGGMILGNDLLELELWLNRNSCVPTPGETLTFRATVTNRGKQAHTIHHQDKPVLDIKIDYGCNSRWGRVYGRMEFAATKAQNVPADVLACSLRKQTWCRCCRDFNRLLEQTPKVNCTLDYAVSNEERKIIRWSDGKPLTPEMMTLELAPGESKSIEMDWVSVRPYGDSANVQAILQSDENDATPASLGLFIGSCPGIGP